MAWGQWGLFAAPRGWGLFAVGGGVAVTFADMSTEGLGARGRRRRGRRARAQRRRQGGESRRVRRSEEHTSELQSQ